MSDDDDGPVFFKRNSAIRKESQLEGTRKQQSLKNRNVTSDKCSSGTDSVSIKNDRATASPNPSFKRSEITKLESSNSSPAKPTLNSVELCEARKQNICLPKPNDSSVKEENDLGKFTDVNCSISEDSEDEKPLIYRRSSLVTKGDPKNFSYDSSKKGITSLNSDDIINHNDIDDDKPLSSRVSAVSGKGDSKILIKNHMNSTSRTKIVAVAKESAEELFETKKFSRGRIKEETDIVKNSCKRSIHEISPAHKPEYSDKELSHVSDDEMPILKRFQMKSSAEASTSAPYEHKINKSISSTLHQNGSLERGNTFKKSPSVINKRPSGEINSDRNSSVKRSKIPPDISSTKIKLPPAKEEPDDDLPISQRMKKSTIRDNKVLNVKKIMNKGVSTPLKHESVLKKSKFFSKYSKSSTELPSSGEGQKWITLEHNGVIFPPPYKRHGVKMLYDGKPVDLNIDQEEVATMFAVMKDTDYATKPRFIENFMTDWKKKLGVNHVIQDFSLCDFTPIYEWHQKEKELKKQMTSEEKNALKEEKLKMEEKFMWAVVDGVKEKVGNFRVEPPGLFRGRGEHPKMGKLKRRIRPSDITINIGKNAPIPECHIPGESWKEIKHDNTVTWLAFWNDPIASKEFKYVFLAPSSSLKGQSDREKYEKARSLRNYIHDIRAAYTSDFNNSNAMRRQIAVATYLIDKLALRAGNEKDDDEADTVGCCTLKVENVKPIPPNILQFDFLGKDSIRYENEVEVELPVYAAIQQFRVGKDGGDGLFDQLDTAKLNAHLKELMPGLTAKVFRTYNASSTLDGMLHSDTKDGILEEKLKVYQLANKQVAIICNHQRTISKSHDSQMSRMTEKIDELKVALMELKTDLSKTKRGKALSKDDDDGKQKRNMTPDMIEKKIEQINIKIEKMELSKQVKEDLKTVALSTSKVSYLDPRITVAWCKRHEVKIEKIFNKSLLAKFSWAMDVSPGFRF